MARQFKKLPPLKEARAAFDYDPNTGEFRSKIGNSWTPQGSIAAKGKSIVVGKENFKKLRFAYFIHTGNDPSPKFVMPADGDSTNATFSNLILTTYSDSQRHNSGATYGPCLGCLRRLGFGLQVMSRIFGIDRGSISSKASRFSGEKRYTGFDELWRKQRMERNKPKNKTISDAKAIDVQNKERLKDIREHGICHRKYEQMYFEKYKHLRRNKVFTTKRVRRQVRRVWYRQTSDEYALDRLGCTVSQFGAHIKKRLKKGWTEENYGTVWNFDHIKPCVAFDLTDEAEIKKLNRYTNIRPMCVVANLTKSGFWEEVA